MRRVLHDVVVLGPTFVVLWVLVAPKVLLVAALRVIVLNAHALAFSELQIDYFLYFGLVRPRKERKRHLLVGGVPDDEVEGLFVVDLDEAEVELLLVRKLGVGELG